MTLSARSQHHSHKRTIAVITTSRSDYAHLRWLLHDLDKQRSFKLRVIALGPHLSPEFGHTEKQLRKDKIEFSTVESLLSSDTDIGMAKSLGVAALGLADLLGSMRPDILFLIADRYEMLAPACIALTLGIPIAHIEGGEITAGAIDDSVRNAITKMAHIHFACTKKAQQRIIEMGENCCRVHWSGSLSLENLRRAKLFSRTQLEKNLGLALRQDSIVVVQHPVTMLKDTTCEARETFAALKHFRQQIVFVYPNADAGSRILIRMAEEFAQHRPDSRVFVNLDHTTYLSLLRHCGALAGNSSSGMIESTSLGIPAVNIGIRQHGREHAANVLDVAADRKAIRRFLERALSSNFRSRCKGLENPYGDGHATKRIIEVLSSTILGPQLLFKNPL